MFAKYGLTARCLVLLTAALLIFAAGCSCGDDDDDDGGAPGDDDTGDDDSGDDDADDDTGGDDDDATDDDSGDDDADDDDTGDDDIDNYPYALIHGPGEPDYDAALEDLARQYDRTFHTFHAAGTGLNQDLTVALADAADRELIRGFVQDTDGWDFETYSGGKTAFDVIDSYEKIAGLYGGVGIVADAYRYAVVRDSGQYSQAEIDLAREHLRAAIEGLFVAVEITGEPGLIARGYNRLDIPGNQDSQVLTPLFDEFGDPLPPEKNNGTWRADNSDGGVFPDFIWEDSCSRDMYIGWSAAFGAAWEVIRDDDAFAKGMKDKLQLYAKEMVQQLATVRPNGYDLEIYDADGRRTFHGFLNENAFDRLYLPFLPFKDGFYAMMSLGIVASLAYVAEDDETYAYLYDTLIAARGFIEIVEQNLIGLHFGTKSNYSGVNMEFMGVYLAMRYIDDPEFRARIADVLANKMYDHPFWPRLPKEQKMSMYDFIFAAFAAGASAYTSIVEEPDQLAVANGVETLHAFPEPPYWDVEIINCDEDEILSGDCIGIDGVTPITVLGYVGRNDDLVAEDPIPKEIRRPSNYEWRSNPYQVNGGGNGTRLLPGVDFRFAYWLGRYTR
ncbi:hypothetical protein K8I61_00385 [bacterium]|nr:hypothetical protein [bacterium]